MNEKQEKKRRYNLRLEFIAHFNKWLDSEPPRWRFYPLAQVEEQPTGMGGRMNYDNRTIYAV